VVVDEKERLFVKTPKPNKSASYAMLFSAQSMHQHMLFRFKGTVA
jgi:hypothetical protein